MMPNNCNYVLPFNCKINCHYVLQEIKQAVMILPHKPGCIPFTCMVITAWGKQLIQLTTNYILR